MLNDRPVPPSPAPPGDGAPTRVRRRDIEALGDQVRLVRQEGRAAAPLADDMELLLEELGVAEEELRTQHDEIVTSNEQLASERARYRELFELAPDAYLVTDLAGAIGEANLAAAAMLAIEPRHLEHKPLIAYVVEPNRRAFRQRLDDVARRCQRVAIPLTLRGRDRRLVDVDATVAPIQDGAGRCTGFRWLLRDVSHERAVERDNERLRAGLERTVVERTAALRGALEELQALYESTATASRRKSEFLAFLSHEVRTPLQAIIGYSELLAMEVHGPLTEVQHADLGRMQRGQQHILRLLDEMLDYARIESGHVELTLQDVPLADLCEAAAELVRPIASASGITIRCDVGDLRVRADFDKTRQVLMNLLTNAAKFGPAHREVTVTAERAGADVVVTVEDHGQPIDDELRDTIFEPFVHLHRATAGSGLGLPISRRLARAMGGDLTLAPASDRGNRFQLVLPSA